MSHPAVEDCSVQGFLVDGVGHIPRAYVSLKSGYMATGEDLVQHANARVAVTERLLGGVAFADKLARDPSGKLFMSLEKFDPMAQGVDEQFLKNQPKVNVS